VQISADVRTITLINVFTVEHRRLASVHAPG
jgi:hypothetical protein